MSRTTRWLIIFLAFLLVFFGLACLNYTKADGIDHHKQVAKEHNLPAPSSGIMWLGAMCISLGSAGIGYLFAGSARRR